MNGYLTGLSIRGSEFEPRIDCREAIGCNPTPRLATGWGWSSLFYRGRGVMACITPCHGVGRSSNLPSSANWLLTQPGQSDPLITGKTVVQIHQSQLKRRRAIIMKANDKKKLIQLGMPHGTAVHKLRKSVIFMLLKKLNANFCHQCSAEIESEDELSIEHKTPWLDSDNPVKNFFDLDNIAFSHLSCNVAAARRKQPQHPSRTSYKNGCRCKDCINANAEYSKNWMRQKRNIGV